MSGFFIFVKYFMMNLNYSNFILEEIKFSSCFG